MTGEPVRVLYFSNSLVRGGAEEHVLTLLSRLDRATFRPFLVCTPETAARLAPDVPADVEVTTLRLRRPGHLGAALRLAALLRRRRIDVLHAHLFYGSLFASPIGRLCRVPLIVETPHVREQWRRGLKSGYLVDRIASRFVDRYIAVSEANARYLAGEKGLPPSKIAVIHNGCDVERFSPRRPPDGLRQQLGFAPADPILVMLARLEPQKGHRVLLEALPAIRRQAPGTRLVCVGEGALRAELEGSVTALGLADAVRFVGQQARPEEWLALGDVTVLPSFYEGLPLVALESLAAGRPVVASAVDGVPEVVVDGQTGLTVPPGSAPALGEAICRLLSDPALRARLGEAGRRRVTERFSADRQVRLTEQLYLGELARGRSPRRPERPREATEGLAAAGARDIH